MHSPRPLAALNTAERLNFLLTNRLPRQSLTRFVGWLSKRRNPVVRWLSINTWRLFVDDLRLDEARKTSFASLHDCFTRELKAGARPIDTEATLVSPCDAVVGEFGSLADLTALQAKGFPYTLDELLGDADLANQYRHGQYVTLRLKSSMYHHFHAPCAGRVSGVRYISGDTWNVNPVALKVVQRLYCRNERAVIPLERHGMQPVLLVAVAAILVASIRIDGLPEPLGLQYDGLNRLALSRDVAKGEHMGYFEHGSTIIMITERDMPFSCAVETGRTIRMGQPLMGGTRNGSPPVNPTSAQTSA